MRTRRKPLRTCIICGEKAPKELLMRVVSTPEGGVSVDTGGRAAGRGAYICAQGDCARQGFKRSRLEHALRTKVKDEEWYQVLSSVEAPEQLG